MVLAALATAGENLDYVVRRADPALGVVVMTSRWMEEKVSFGFIATGLVEVAGSSTVSVELDVTPRVGFWAVAGSAEQADALVQELRHILQAPKARVRRPRQAGRPGRPFAYRPEIGGALWALASLLVYGLLVGGWWWIAATAGGIGGLLLALPSDHRAWGILVNLSSLLSIPFGFVGFSLRREALAQAYWQRIRDNE